MDEVVEAQKKAAVVAEPPMFAVQLDLRDSPNICGSGVEAALETLGSYAASSVQNVTTAIVLLGYRNAHMDLSKEMTKEIADQLYPKVLADATNAHLYCGCKAKINLRLEKTK